jgi:hypothetical protein
MRVIFVSIIDYVNNYGKYSFDEVEFNEIDNVIFSCLSYLNLDGIVSCGKNNKKSIGLISKEFFKGYSSKNKNIMAYRNACDILNSIKDKKRYKDIDAYYYSYIGDDSQQFSAMCFDISLDVVFVSFEGTDHLISGWEEDFKMIYEFPVLAQKHAINYLNKHFTFSNKRLILGGHSKGGNLALVALMYCNFIVRGKIIKIYDNDGPGLRKRQLESFKYKRVEDKIIHIIPNYSIVGLLLRHTDKYIVIKSNKKSIVAHSVMTWEVDGDHFKRSKLSNFSKILDDGVIKWLDKYDDNKRREFVISLFDIFRKARVNNLTQIMENKRLILKLIRESKDMDIDNKNMIRDFIYVIFNYFKDYEIEKFKELF